jgi:hypothetical protein
MEKMQIFNSFLFLCCDSGGGVMVMLMVMVLVVWLDRKGRGERRFSGGFFDFVVCR